MIKREYRLYGDCGFVPLKEPEVPTEKRAVPLCHHLFGRSTPSYEEKPVPKAFS
jgi:hypothetical protein